MNYNQVRKKAAKELKIELSSSAKTIQQLFKFALEEFGLSKKFVIEFLEMNENDLIQEGGLWKWKNN